MRITNCLKIEWEIGDNVKTTAEWNNYNRMGVYGTVTEVTDDFLHGQVVTINNGAYNVARSMLEAY